MRELDLSVYYDAGRFIAGVRDGPSQTYVDRKGLEHRIFRRLARLEDTERMEEQLALMDMAESFLKQAN